MIGLRIWRRSPIRPFVGRRSIMGCYSHAISLITATVFPVRSGKLTDVEIVLTEFAARIGVSQFFHQSFGQSFHRSFFDEIFSFYVF